ncbi:MAG: hypothetical protein Q9179_002028 [Wetmoreana sp. 5 TL-2023]
MADPSDSMSNALQDSGDRHAELQDLIAQATLKYSIKDYDAAAELYSQATEMQAELSGEMAASNADLLYAYGRCLYHLAVRSSDVLGSKVAGEKQEPGSERARKSKGKRDSMAAGESTSTKNTEATEKAIAQAVKDEVDSAKPKGGQHQGGKPYFQFTGDENFDDSDDDADAPQLDGESGDEPDEEDDFANAFEVLDLARVLLLKQLQEEEEKQQQQQQDDRRTKTDPSEKVRQLKERLADTHDLQAEISLEGERFPNAVVDLQAALDLKKGLFPKESSLIAEAHFKLSLALEFSSITRPKAEDGESNTKAEANVDGAMREEAAKEMEAAIASCKLRMSKEEAKLREGEGRNGMTEGETRNGKATEDDIKDVKDMVAEMEQRLTELRQPPVSIDDASKGDNNGAAPLAGILGSILGVSPAAQRERLEEAAKGATDLSNLVKRRKPVGNAILSTADAESAKTGGKRKVEFAETREVGTGKKAKLSDGDEDNA